MTIPMLERSSKSGQKSADYILQPIWLRSGSYGWSPNARLIRTPTSIHCGICSGCLTVITRQTKQFPEIDTTDAGLARDGLVTQEQKTHRSVIQGILPCPGSNKRYLLIVSRHCRGSVQRWLFLRCYINNLDWRQAWASEDYLSWKLYHGCRYGIKHSSMSSSRG